MGTTASGCIQVKMFPIFIVVLLASCLSNVDCQRPAYPPAPPPQYPTPSPGKDGVCDTTYDIDTTTKDDYQYCNVETPNCYMEEKTINDVTCTNTVEFNCKREKTTKNDGYGQKEVVCTRTP